MVPLLTATVGFELTVMFAVATLVEIQPAVLVPITVYDVLDGGDTIELPP